MAVYLGSHQVDMLGGANSGGGGGDALARQLLDGSLTEITTPSGLTNIADSRLGSSYPNLTSIIVSEGVTAIGNQFGYRCLKLEKVELPSTVTSIGNYFCGVLGSETSTAGKLDVYIYADTPPTLGNNLFAYRTNKVPRIYVPSNSVSAYRSASGWSAFSGYIQAIPE